LYASLSKTVAFARTRLPPVDDADALGDADDAARAASEAASYFANAVDADADIVIILFVLLLRALALL
jgi:hypothetical protein